MRSACSSRGKEETGAENVAEPRDLHLHVSTNRLEKGNSDIVACIEEGQTPTELTMRMVEYQKEDHFRQLLAALRTNKTIRRLDISKASLPYDASAETCEALQSVFADNVALEELDISGEHAHLEVARFGIGLNQALGGLKNNKTLKVLTIEYQNLGLEGANTLSTVLENNSTLTHINCAHNGISLQGFTVLTNAMAKNFSVVHLPMMQGDCEEAVRRMKAQIMDTKISSSSTTVGSSSKPGAANSGGGSVDNVKHIARRTLNSLTLGVSTQSKGKNVATIQDVEQAVAHLLSKWLVQSERLHGFLYRNAQIADGVEGWGVDGEGVGAEENLRPATAMSDRGIIEHVMSNTTPKLELQNPVDWEDGKLGLAYLNELSMGMKNDAQMTDGGIVSSSEAFSNVDRDDGNRDSRVAGMVESGNSSRPMSSVSDYAATERPPSEISDGMRASMDLAAALDRVLSGGSAGAGDEEDNSKSSFKLGDQPGPKVDSVVGSEGQSVFDDGSGRVERHGNPRVVVEEVGMVGENGIFDMDP